MHICLCTVGSCCEHDNINSTGSPLSYIFQELQPSGISIRIKVDQLNTNKSCMLLLVYILCLVKASWLSTCKSYLEQSVLLVKYHVHAGPRHCFCDSVSMLWYACSCLIAAYSVFFAVVWGECNHSFHNCCMSLWVNHGQNNRCPLCQQDWVVQRIGK